MTQQVIDNDGAGAIAIVTREDVTVTHELTHECRLTTTNNPYDPFIEYEEWYRWDEEQGYYSPGLLARINRTSSDLSDADQRRDAELAINKIVVENWFGVHRKVWRPLEG